MGERLGFLAPVYESYKINSLRFDVELLGPTTEGAAVWQYFDRDPADEPVPATADGIKLIGSMEHNSLVRQASRGVMTVYGDKSEPKTCTFDGDIGEAYSGSWVLMCVGAGANTTYVVRLTYDISFYDPQIDHAMLSTLYEYAFNVSVVPTSWFYDGCVGITGTEALGATFETTQYGHTLLRLLPGTYRVANFLEPTDAPSGSISLLSLNGTWVGEVGSITQEFTLAAAYGGHTCVTSDVVYVPEASVALLSFTRTGNLAVTGDAVFRVLLSRVNL